MELEVWRPKWGLRPWQSFREMEPPENIFKGFFGQPFPSLMRHTPLIDKEWAPALEMFEKNDKFVIKAELPGIKQEDVDISVSDSMLTIKGEKSSEKEVEEEEYYFSETTYGSFFRSVNLPSNADSKNVTACMDNGILEIDIPKVAQAKAKKIAVVPKKKVVEGKKKPAKSVKKATAK